MGSRTKPPEPNECLILEDFTHPHKQETRSLDTIQATSFFPWWLLLFFQDKKIVGQSEILLYHNSSKVNWFGFQVMIPFYKKYVVISRITSGNMKK